jgi:hypothetical protein
VNSYEINIEANAVGLATCRPINLGRAKEVVTTSISFALFIDIKARLPGGNPALLLTLKVPAQTTPGR